MSDDRHIRARAARAYAATKARGGLAGAVARAGQKRSDNSPPVGRRPASDADTMSFARDRPREDWRAAPPPRRPSIIAQGFGFGLGFAAGTGLFRVVMFLILFGGLMLLLFGLAASVL